MKCNFVEIEFSVLGCTGNHSELRCEMICCRLASHALGVNAKNYFVCRKAPR